MTAARFPLALYDVDHTHPTVSTTWGQSDAGVAAVAHGTVVQADIAGTLGTVVLEATDGSSITVCWPATPDTGLPDPGEQVLTLGLLRPDPAEQAVVMAQTAPYRTGRQAPTQPGPRPDPKPPAPRQPRTDTRTEPPPPKAEAEPVPPAVQPLLDAVMAVMRDDHSGEPWGVTCHREQAYVAVVYRQDDDCEAREAVMDPWRVSLRKAGLAVQTRFDLLAAGKAGPTREPAWLLISPGPDPTPPDVPEDHGPLAGPEQIASIRRMGALMRYRALAELRNY